MQQVHRKSELLFYQNNLTMAQLMVLDAPYHKGDLTIKQIISAVLPFGKRHKKLWLIVRETLQAIVLPEQFSSTDQKITSFADGHGTILFFEEMDMVAQLQKLFSLYADNFPIWSNQSSGMLQFAVWAAFSTEGQSQP